MLHPELVIEIAPDLGKKITDENKIDELLKRAHICFAIGDIAPEVEFPPARAAFIG